MLRAYRFVLDPTPALASHCGAARKAFNESLAHVKRCLDQRAAECSYGVPREQLTEVPWTLPALRRWWNASKPTLAPWWPENSKESTPHSGRQAAGQTGTAPPQGEAA